jgi:tetratricopeptide (TPR) repeat protein
MAAADEARLALDLRAQTEFDRVDLAGVARLEDAGQCVQSQSAALAVAPPADAALLHYRKGYCLLASAAITHRAEEYAAAADELENAIETWSARGRKGYLEPVSPGLRVLATIARLKAGADVAGVERARGELASAVIAPVCSSDVMTPAFCQQVVAKGRQWLGWMALKRGDLPEAGRDFAGTSDAWTDWVEGRQAFTSRRYEAAATRYKAAIGLWEGQRRESPPNTLTSFGPRPDFAEALTDWGSAQLLGGQPREAIATLDQAAHEDPSRARPLYLRALAKEATGDEAEALTDYSLASRTAFASTQDLASGEAHFYRGILFYRRKDWARAEDEFSSALNFDIPPSLRPDAEAWRHLAAVAGGSCQASRSYLEQSLESVSPYFPKAEARERAASCVARGGVVAGGSAAN